MNKLLPDYYAELLTELKRRVRVACVENRKLQPLVGEVSWAKNLVTMSRYKEALGR